MGDVLISVRAVLHPRRTYKCTVCRGDLLHHLYLYGAAFNSDPRSAHRVHWYCTNDPTPRIQEARTRLRFYEEQLQVHVRDRRGIILKPEGAGLATVGGWVSYDRQGYEYLGVDRTRAKLWRVGDEVRRHLAANPERTAYVEETDVALNLDRALDPSTHYVIRREAELERERRAALRDA